MIHKILWKNNKILVYNFQYSDLLPFEFFKQNVMVFLLENNNITSMLHKRNMRTNILSELRPGNNSTNFIKNALTGTLLTKTVLYYIGNSEIF